MSATIAVQASSDSTGVQDDLNRESLPRSQRDPGRKFAWTNAVCFSVLAIGILLRQDAQQSIFKPGPVEPPPVVVLEFIPEQKMENVEPVPEEQPAEQPVDAPVIPTLVAPESTKVNFVVEVSGPTVTRADISKIGPPPRETRRAAPAKTGPTIFRGDTGTDGGFYPKPTYPRDALQRRESGEVQAYVEVAEDGSPAKVEIRVSSGSRTLDRTLLNQVRNRWRWPASPGTPIRQYLVPFEFKIN